MSQAKLTANLILSTLILCATINATANTMMGFLDLSKLNQNAGRYFIGLALNTKTTAALEITQKLANPKFQTNSDIKVCLSTFKVNAGDYSIILVDADTDQSLTITQKIELYSYHYDETESCTSNDELLASPLNFKPRFNVPPIKLNRMPPAGYNEFIAMLKLLPYGQNVILNISKNNQTTYFVENLKTQLDLQLQRNKAHHIFKTYVQKKSDNGTLKTLATEGGFFELK